MKADLAKAIFVLGLLIFAAIRFPSEYRAWRIAKQRNVRAPIEKLLLVAAVTGLYVVPLAYVIFGFPRAANRPIVPLIAWLGALLYLGAQAVLYLAHKQLGRNFSASLVIREDHALVDTGIYRYVRHPIYSGLWLWAIGQALLLPNWVAGLTGLIGFGILYFARVGREEELMLETFGEPYRAYMRQTPRVMPWPFFGAGNRS